MIMKPMPEEGKEISTLGKELKNIEQGKTTLNNVRSKYGLPIIQEGGSLITKVLFDNSEVLN